MKINRMAGVVLMFCCGFQSAFSDETEVLRRRVYKEGLSSQSLYRQRLLGGCSFRCRYEIIQAQDQSQNSEESVVVFDYPNRVIETKNRVSCVNETYGFTLSRRKENLPWFVTQIDTGNLENFLRSGMYEGKSHLTLEELLIDDEVPVLDVSGIPIERFLATQTITIADIHADNQGRIAVNFSGTVPSGIGKGSILGGTIWLVPDRFWAIDEYLIEVTSDEKNNIAEGTIQRKVQWSEVGGVSVPVSVSTKSFPAGNFRLERRQSYSHWEIREYLPERFHMPHYGLSEPGIVAQSPTGKHRWLLWLNLAGFVLIVVGVALRYRLKLPTKIV